MSKIFCLMGKSSTGKDTIFKRLLQVKGLQLKTIVPYTTRPIRVNEQNGIEYFFTDEEGFQRLLSQGKVIEERSYNTFHGLWRYFTVDDGQIFLEEKDYVIIGTLEAYIHMKQYFGAKRVVPVYIDLDDGVRLQRALDRERKQEHPKYEEMCRRFLADSEDFAPQKLLAEGIHKYFYNDDLDRCLGEIVDYIKEVLQCT